MIVFTVKTDKKKAILLLVAIAVAAAALFGIGQLHRYVKARREANALFAGSTWEERSAFCRRFGCEISEEEEKEEPVRIPAEFNETYTSYNALQKNCGMDLAAYKGKEAVRYSYPVSGQKLLIRLLVCEGRIVAADVLSVSGGGKVYGIGEKTEISEVEAAAIAPPNADHDAWPID